MLGLGGAALMRRRRHGQDDELDELAAEEAVYAAPVDMAPEPVTTAAPQPVFAATPAAARSAESLLEAMVAQPPSPENPFRTYAKRMTRAKFLLAQQQRAAAPQAALSPEASPAAPRPTPQPTQTVYRFGSDRGRKTMFNPRTS